MKRMFRMLLPTTLPTAMSVWPTKLALSGDREFRRTGAEGDHGQPNHQRRDPGGSRQPGGSAHQHFAARAEGQQSGQDQAHGDRILGHRFASPRGLW